MKQELLDYAIAQFSELLDDCYSDMQGIVHQHRIDSHKWLRDQIVNEIKERRK